MGIRSPALSVPAEKMIGQPLLRYRKPFWIAIAALMVGLSAVYALIIRPYHMRWGATDREIAMVLLEQGLGLAWTPALAATIRFWLILPLVTYVVAGGLAGWQVNRMIPA